MAQGTCWDGYEQKGFKKKGNRSVPNCVKKFNSGDEVKKKDAPVDDTFKEKQKKSVYPMRRFVPNIDSDMRIYRRISSFKEPQEIKSGGLIKGKPKLALRGWK
jgi:hypothetical protein